MELALLHSAHSRHRSGRGLGTAPGHAETHGGRRAESHLRELAPRLPHFPAPVLESGAGRTGQQVFSRLAVLQYKDALVGDLRETPAGPKRRFSSATVNLRLAAVRALAQEAADAGLLDQSEAAAIGRIRGEKQTGSRIGMWIEKQELDRILLSPDRSTLRGKRDYALLAVLFSTGIRRRELVELSVSTLQQRDGQWGLIDLRGKGRKVRSVSVPLWVKDAVFEWLEASQIVQGALF